MGKLFAIISMLVVAGYAFGNDDKKQIAHSEQLPSFLILKLNTKIQNLRLIA